MLWLGQARVPSPVKRKKKKEHMKWWSAWGSLWSSYLYLVKWDVAPDVCRIFISIGKDSLSPSVRIYLEVQSVGCFKMSNLRVLRKWNLCPRWHNEKLRELKLRKCGFSGFFSLFKLTQDFICTCQNMANVMMKIFYLVSPFSIHF